MLQVESTRIGGAVGLKLRGEVDHENANLLGGPLLDLIVRGHVRLVLDLREVSYLDGAGLGVLLLAIELLPPDGRISLLGPRPDVQRLLELSGLGAGRRCRIILAPNSVGDAGQGQTVDAGLPLSLAPTSSD